MSGDMTKRQFGAGVLEASPRLFANPLLDKLSRVHHLTPLFVYLPVIAVLSGRSVGEAGRFSGFCSASCWDMRVWTIAEYWGHRVLFHCSLPGKLGARITFLIHGVHHVHPNDPLRLVMPPLLSAPLMLFGFCVLRLSLRPSVRVAGGGGFHRRLCRL